jgi:threonine/homoserine/homoserine lactone efflux protein
MGEFAGVAAIGGILVVGAVVALIVFVVMFAFMVTRRKAAAWIAALRWTLTAAVAVFLDV